MKILIKEITMNFQQGLNYLQFKNTREKDEDLEMITKKEIMQTDFFNSLSEDLLKKISNINKKTYIGVFSSAKCPDAATLTPLLLNLASLNNNICVKFFKKDDTSDFLEKNLNETKIPTVLNLSSDNEIIAKYCEFPCALKAILREKNFREDADIVIDDFRNGQYNTMLLEELINLILGHDHKNYITFDKSVLPYRNPENQPQ